MFRLSKKTLKEVKISKPGPALFKNNNSLYDFLNKNIKDFAKNELERNYTDNLLQLAAEVINEEIDYNTEFSDLDFDTQQRLINYLVEVGLKYYGEWDPEDSNGIYGILWNIDNVDLIYNWTDKVDPGSYNWDDTEFKGRKFYSLSYDI